MFLDQIDGLEVPFDPPSPPTPPKLPGNGGNDSAPPSGPPIWRKGITSYRDDLRAIRFRSIEALFAVIDLFWNEPELKGAPRMPLGGTTLLVPSEAAEILEAKGIAFVDEPVAKSEDFDAKKLEQLRKSSSMTSDFKVPSFTI